MEITEISEYCRKNEIKPQTKMLAAMAASTRPSRQMAVSERPSPQLEREQNLLAEIADIADSETANKAKDLLHSEKHIYTFDAYLYWLSELSHLLLCGMSKDDALKVICTCVYNPGSAGHIYQQLAKAGII